ncbi:hypothetical protein FA13DRAFT_1793446 [Coprinellus micaceus]|uniref:Uncharacterized protein n=1 Tax=Coprinellus micaceus TaxID=71717 RepID=A0A4Y7T5W1_COPMI|nr:hypothetical protein FA13DRAFT_1793446 [Coprinellus micaceus]
MSGLVRRSGCSLKRLALASSNKPVEYSDFCELLSLCPELESLDIPLPDNGSTIFNSLIVEPFQSVSTPIVPKLRTLGLHYHSGALLQPDFGIPDCVNALVEAIQSRSPPRGGLLEEVNFFWTSTLALHNMLFVGNSAFDIPDGGVDTKADKMFNDAGRLALHEHLQGRSSESSWQAAYYSPAFVVNMDLFMRTLEGRKVNKTNTMPLLRYGYLGALHNLSQEAPGVIVGDRVFRFRTRARKLLSKWKPSILRDTRRFGHRWCQYNEGDLSLKWNKASESDADIWKDILTTRKPPGLDPKAWSGCFEARPRVPVNL